MATTDPRKMALEIAGVRAAESSLPEDEQVFQDPYAACFFSPKERKNIETPEQVRAQIESYNQIMPGVNGAIVARIRFIDEYVKTCIEKGFKQMVVIGAGYDTRAHRIDGAKENLSVFEVDHPLTQETKIKTIKTIFGSLPGHVTYVPMVFGREQLDEKLSGAGYKRGLKTLFIVEGLLMYIPPAAVEALLRVITGISSAGSALVADYFHTDVIEGTSGLREAKALKQFVEKAGSRLMFGLDPGSVSDFFTRQGFHNLEQVSAPSCKALYFKGESRKRTVSSMFNFITAVVAPS
ncbi:SAM-dependent methyltransferase [Desulfospira joergensenii]|uniref:SAM-dependent methyltransferase n=1 Tax=Desulfospira joergensenii TaxID=53329 RepID=UPI0003B4E126|nr:class I SAM-dependent methyltransferase [Desulfospira joergensenii]